MYVTRLYGQLICRMFVQGLKYQKMHLCAFQLITVPAGKCGISRSYCMICASGRLNPRTLASGLSLVHTQTHTIRLAYCNSVHFDFVHCEICDVIKTLEYQRKMQIYFTTLNINIGMLSFTYLKNQQVIISQHR